MGVSLSWVNLEMTAQQPNMASTTTALVRGLTCNQRVIILTPHSIFLVLAWYFLDLSIDGMVCSEGFVLSPIKLKY